MENTIIASGKTKELYTTDNPDILRMRSLDNLSAGDGAYQANLAVGASKNRQNALVMAHLEKNGINTSFIKQVSETDSLVKGLDMMDVECVVRGIPFGSYTKRNPLSGIYTDHMGFPLPLDAPVFEMFHKRTVFVGNGFEVMLKEKDARRIYCRGGIWHAYCHTDPYIEPNGNKWDIYDKAKPTTPENKLTTIPAEISTKTIDEMRGISLAAYNLIKDGWGNIRVEGEPVALADIKFEFGQDTRGNLCLGDVVDNDGWRIWVGGNPKRALDKQLFRDGVVSNDVVEKTYAQVAKLLEAL